MMPEAAIANAGFDSFGGGSFFRVCVFRTRARSTVVSVRSGNGPYDHAIVLYTGVRSRVVRMSQSVVGPIERSGRMCTRHRNVIWSANGAHITRSMIAEFPGVGTGGAT